MDFGKVENEDISQVDFRLPPDALEALFELAQFVRRKDREHLHRRNVFSKDRSKRHTLPAHNLLGILAPNG